MTAITRVLSEAKSKTSTLDSFSKMLTNGWKAVEVSAKVASPAISNLAQQFSGFSAVVGGLNIIERVHDWATVASSKDKRKEWTGPKYASQACLTVSHSLEFLNFGDKMKLWSLGSFTAQVVPGIVPLEIVKNVFYIPASVCGIWHSFLSMGKQDAKVANWEAKRDKWTQRKLDAATNPNDFKENVINPKIDLLKANIEQYAPKKAENLLDANEERIYTKLHSRLHRWESYKEEIEEDDDGKSDTLNDACNFKIDQYDNNINVEKRNSGKLKTKEWLTVVNNIGKFIFGVIGLLAAALAWSAAAFVATVAVGWFATHLFNFAKGIYEGRDENKIIKLQKPTFPINVME